MYYEPIEDGDVRMISLNYVKADEQSIYQIGEDAGSGEDPADPAADPAAGAHNKLQAIALYIPTQKSERKGV